MGSSGAPGSEVGSGIAVYSQCPLSLQQVVGHCPVLKSLFNEGGACLYLVHPYKEKPQGRSKQTPALLFLQDGQPAGHALLCQSPPPLPIPRACGTCLSPLLHQTHLSRKQVRCEWSSPRAVDQGSPLNISEHVQFSRELYDVNSEFPPPKVHI